MRLFPNQEIKDIISTYVTYFELGLPYGGERFQYLRLEHGGEAVEVPAHVVHHGEDAVVHELAVAVIVLEQHPVLVHYIRSCKPEDQPQVNIIVLLTILNT